MNFIDFKKGFMLLIYCLLPLVKNKNKNISITGIMFLIQINPWQQNIKSFNHLIKDAFYYQTYFVAFD